MARRGIDRLLSLSLVGASTTDLGIAATTSVPAFAGDDFFSVFFLSLISYFDFLCLAEFPAYPASRRSLEPITLAVKSFPSLF